MASSRATVYAALVPESKNRQESEEKKKFIVTLSKWENSLNSDLTQRAQNEILKANGEVRPVVLDPFAGGGAIPLSTLELGCETYASDYNPVATILLKCTLEYPQKYREGTSDRPGETRKSLSRDVTKWGLWVLNKVKDEIEQFFPQESNGLLPVGYIWSRTIPCQNPTCGAQIPLLRQFLLSTNGGRMISLYPSIVGKEVRFKIVGSGYGHLPKGFDPNRGTVQRAVATCLVCGSVVDGDTLRNLFVSGDARASVVAAVLRSSGRTGKQYREGAKNDFERVRRAEEYLKEKQPALANEWGMNPVPDEPTPEGKGPGAERAFSIRNYNMKAWGDLFNARQKLVLVSFTEKIREAHKTMIAEGYDNERATIVSTYLGIALDRLADYDSTLTRWVPRGEFIGNTFTRQVLPMVWDYFELVPWSNATGDWNSALGWIARVIEHISALPSVSASVSQQSAANLKFPNEFFDAVVTDPPYYDNVPYSFLSDFFYVWLKRSIGQLHPDLFATPLTPKSDEIVAYSIGGDFEAGRKRFETLLAGSFSEIKRVLKADGICIIVFAHKSTAGWESLVNSLLHAGLTITGAWPVHTEMKARMRAKESAALASSIYLVCRNLTKVPVGFYSEVRQELRSHLASKLDRLWAEGISGADFLISGIGSSIEIFGRYQKIMDDEGVAIRVDRLLEDVRKIVTDYALRQVLHNGFAGEITPTTRFYILWRWAYGETKVDFDDARKLGQSVGVDVSQEWNRGFISKEKEFIEALGPEDRGLESLEGSTELIDVLHRVLLLWKKGKYDEVTNVLRETGYGKSDVFYRVSQAVSESLIDGDREKKLLDGFLSGKERIVKEVKKQGGQSRLFE